MSFDDAFRLRIDDRAADDESTRVVHEGAAGSPSVVVSVVTGAANAFCACTPQDVTGGETAGSAGTLTARSGTRMVLNLGGTAPAAGTKLLATWVDHRWVCRYD